MVYNQTVQLNLLEQDTITALATSVGKAGIGIVRVSGPLVRKITETIFGHLPEPRYATYGRFMDISGATIDLGIVIFFPAPNSFTGDDIIEFHGHGSPIVLNELLKNILYCGARLAEPGEFTKRAFLQGKIDLIQAEAVADLIDAASLQAAQWALKSLQGKFSAKIAQMNKLTIEFRTKIEACLDFSEEDLPLLKDAEVSNTLLSIYNLCQEILINAEQGIIVRSGIKVVLIGEPNVGKSTLLNKITTSEASIVTAVPGTTRDLIKTTVMLSGVPFNFVDTAGLCDSNDLVELEGIKRALQEVSKADLVFLVSDKQCCDKLYELEKKYLQDKLNKTASIVYIFNKIDITGVAAKLVFGTSDEIYLSAKQDLGIDILREYLINKFCFANNSNEEQGFIARRRHIQSLNQAKKAIDLAKNSWEHNKSYELLAESLRLVQDALGEILGITSTDDLLANIFSSFCIGK